MHDNNNNESNQDNSQDIESQSMEQMFEQYLRDTLKIRVDSKRFGHLVASLKDAFFAGAALAVISDRNLEMEILAYIQSKKPGAADQKGWLN